MMLRISLLASCSGHSLANNNLNVEGGKAIAAVIGKTKITHLKCASPLPPPKHPQNVTSPGDADNCCPPSLTASTTTC